MLPAGREYIQGRGVMAIRRREVQGSSASAFSAKFGTPECCCTMRSSHVRLANPGAAWSGTLDSYNWRAFRNSTLPFESCRSQYINLSLFLTAPILWTEIQGTRII